MPKPEWGKKRQCQSCGTKFYDMQRSEIVCPSCGAVYEASETPARSRRSRAAARSQPREAPAAAPEEAEADLGTAEEGESESEADVAEGEPAEKEEDYDMIEDVSELGEEEDFADVPGEEDEER